ncbi:hypothetical protein TREES_T100021466 [Tupaia chinensis]|uniref:Uncharacterized protein n=1 Tax=Tupaia chinensis TaxID=246437 RepID=L9KHF0_TUPCH|nr:hypothetical protein TREES_T100021466 [Tupaia chinensis]
MSGLTSRESEVPSTSCTRGALAVMDCPPSPGSLALTSSLSWAPAAQRPGSREPLASAGSWQLGLQVQLEHHWRTGGKGLRGHEYVFTGGCSCLDTVLSVLKALLTTTLSLAPPPHTPDTNIRHQHPTPDTTTPHLTLPPRVRYQHPTRLTPPPCVQHQHPTPDTFESGVVGGMCVRL